MKKIINNGSIDFLMLFQIFKQRAKDLKFFFLSSFILMMIFYIFSDRLYTSNSVLAPVSNSSKGDVSSVLAAQFGLASEIEIDPLTIFESEDLRKSIIYKERLINGEKINLIDLWEYDDLKWYNPFELMNLFINTIFPGIENNSTVKDRVLEVKAIKELNKRLSFKQDFYTNEIKISSTMESRDLAKSLNQEIINYLDDFITSSTNKDAASKVFYMQKRINEVENDLNESEDGLETFLSENKSYKDSPRLLIEFMRLQREVELNSAIKIQLSAQVEINKVEEISKVPNFVIVDYPTYPSKKVYPRGSIFIIYLIIFYLLFVLIIVIYRDFRRIS
ncbi:MAG: hypothetical protein ISQ41_06585 [Flavobacteriaceae bacterium]|nr:hypothetical protein [Flavobacteriaceae bacterium]MBL6685115.1 hypothetical protein [Flavobacteriaceae bacterium]